MIFGLETQALNLREDYDAAVTIASDVPTPPPTPALCQLLKSTVQCFEADGTTLALSSLLLKNEIYFMNDKTQHLLFLCSPAGSGDRVLLYPKLVLDWLCSRG